MVMETRVVQQGDNRKSSTFAAVSIVYMHLIHNLEMAEMLLNKETVSFLTLRIHIQALFLSVLIKNGTKRKMEGKFKIIYTYVVHAYFPDLWNDKLYRLVKISYDGIREREIISSKRKSQIRIHFIKWIRETLSIGICYLIVFIIRTILSFTINFRANALSLEWYIW